MSDSQADTIILPSPMDTWILPLGDDQPCGPNLEFELGFHDLEQAVAGKPETSFAPAKPPDWQRARGLAEDLLKRTRDLRVAMCWGRARVSIDGFSALPLALTLLHVMLERFWDHLHPLPDSDDQSHQARQSVMAGLDNLSGLLGDVRNAPLSEARVLDGLRVRDVEVALDKLAARPGDVVRTHAQVLGFLAADPEIAERLRAQAESALESLKAIQALALARFNTDMGLDLKAMTGMLNGVISVLPERVDVAVESADPEGSLSDPRRIAEVRYASGVHSIDSRQDAVRAIELVCAYLERNEPTNPAQLLLRRASRVIDMNFLQLVRDLAPDAVKDVARILGVNPAEISDQN